MVLSAAKEATHHVRYVGMRRVSMILIRRAGSVLLKAPCMSCVCVCSLLFANPLHAAQGAMAAAVFYSALSRPQLTESQTGAPRSPAPQLTAPPRTE